VLASRRCPFGCCSPLRGRDSEGPKGRGSESPIMVDHIESDVPEQNEVVALPSSFTHLPNTSSTENSPTRHLNGQWIRDHQDKYTSTLQMDGRWRPTIHPVIVANCAWRRRKYNSERTVLLSGNSGEDETRVRILERDEVVVVEGTHHCACPLVISGLTH